LAENTAQGESQFIKNKSKEMRPLSIFAIASAIMLGQACNPKKENSTTMKQTEQTEQYTFHLSDKVSRQKVTFKNRYGKWLL